ncbi:hypothetical protein L7F22_064031 [Adiantum nelumboides]|nr:hypothetical protein [Adiantum nelumboides]
MCGGPEQLKTTSSVTCLDGEMASSHGAVGATSAIKGGDCDLEQGELVSYLLELAASNDLEGFQGAVKEQKAKVNEVGSWYGRRNGSTAMVWEQRTPAMIASIYGSVDVLKFILSSYDHLEDINMKCGSDSCTALHCAAAGGSARALETVILLLDFGADMNAVDAQGRRPADLIAAFPKLKHVEQALKGLLELNSVMQHFSGDFLDEQEHDTSFLIGDRKSGCMGSNGKVDCTSDVTNSVFSFSSSGGSPFSSPSPSSSPKALDTAAGKGSELANEKVKEYFIDPSIPDIKNSLYTTDEFRMFSFKIRPCSRAYSHDWTECPFVHPGENARRRDPRRYHYSCVPCPEFRKGACRRGDACEYAHGVFECWLHPAQYRTRLCKDGTDCSRRVCFFAHTNDELRPLYLSSGSAIPCPRTTSPLDLVASSPPLGPVSPSSALMMNAFSSSGAQGTHTTPPMSPSSPANSLAGAAWSPSNVPALHLPGVSLHASRLRSSLNARDISLEEFGRVSEFDAHLVNETSLASHALCTQARLNAAVAARSSSRYRNLGLTISPTNLDEFFSSELMPSPRSMLQDKSSPVQAHMQVKLGSPGITSMPDQYFQLQQAVALESQLQCSPRMYSPKQMPTYSLGSLGRMSALGGLDVDIQTCNNALLPPSVVAARAAFAQRDKRSHSSRDLGAGFSVSDWGSPTGKPEWGVQRDDLSKFQKSASFGYRRSEEPDLSWVHTLVKEGPPEGDKGFNGISKDEFLGPNKDPVDQVVLSSWMENLQLDEIVA